MLITCYAHVSVFTQRVHIRCVPWAGTTGQIGTWLPLGGPFPPVGTQLVRLLYTSLIILITASDLSIKT